MTTEHPYGSTRDWVLIEEKRVQEGELSLDRLVMSQVNRSAWCSRGAAAGGGG
jgi:hypothetical protein